MGLTKEMARHARRRGRLLIHLDNGWPHYSTTTAIPMCICLDRCCQDDIKGCVCKSCPCRMGVGHGTQTVQSSFQKEVSPTLEKERANQNHTSRSEKGA